MKIDSEQYYQHVRLDLIETIPSGAHKVLEVGCAEGATCMTLKNNGCATELVGIELVPEAAAVAAQNLDHVICGDIEQLPLDQACFEPASFDYIICGDVLEHMKDPWGQLVRLVALLKSGGKIIVSLPNIRYYGISLPLIFKDDWTYTQAGILDSTHLRFFTRKTSVQMLCGAGLKSPDCFPLISRRRDSLLQKFSLGLLTGMVTPQWRLIAEKA